MANHPIELPPLPYSIDALEPFVSARTLTFHHQKHHYTYVNNLNALLVGNQWSGLTLPEIIIASAGKAEHIGIFNNAAQVWNHTFLWNSMSPKVTQPQGKLAMQIEHDFGDMETLLELFKKEAIAQFGSGWAWLVWDGSKLAITKTANADLPLLHRQIPLLAVDVWEHAYYLDYQNRRADYLDAFLRKLLNWQFAEDNFNKALMG